MKTTPTSRWVPFTQRVNRPALALLATAALAFLTACATSKTSQTESSLVIAGFKTVAADTPARLEKLMTLPEGKLSKVLKDGQTYYVYPDRKKSCLLVGQEAQYRMYKEMLINQQIARSDADAFRQTKAEAQMDATAEFQTYSAGWDSFAWGGAW